MVTVFYYNPNISSDEEYKKRVAEQIRFIKEFDTPNKVEFIEGDYEPDVFFKEVKGLEKEPEGGKRCFKCYELRLRKTAELAKAEAYDYFTTTLTISPLKNSVKLNETGLKLQEEYGVNYLLSDFKKQEGYKRSIELSKEYGLYRQNYCGCVYSRQQILMSKQIYAQSGGATVATPIISDEGLYILTPVSYYSMLSLTRQSIIRRNNYG